MSVDLDLSNLTGYQPSTVLDNYQLNGSAQLQDGETISLTTNTGDEAGSAILKDLVITDAQVTSGIAASYNMAADSNGADGHGCFLLDASQPETALGQSGGGKGYAGLACCGFAVEEFSGGSSFIFTSDTSGNVQQFDAVTEDNATVTGAHLYVVEFEESAGTGGNVTIGMTVLRDGTQLLTGQVSIPATGDGFRLGFSAGTGGGVAAHTLATPELFFPKAPPAWVPRRASY